jgi:hypothetical protein
MEKEKVEAHPLVRNILKGYRGMLELRDGTRKN